MSMEWQGRIFPEMDYPIIDAHVHPYFNRDCPKSGPQDYDQYQQELSDAGISFFCGAFMLPNDGADPEILRKENDVALQWREHFGRHFYPGVNIHPNHPEASIAEVKRFYDLGFRWVGEIAGYVQGYRNYAVPEMEPILETMSDLGMILNIHPSSVEDADRLLSRFPRLKVVLAHPGQFGCNVSFSLAEKHPNAYWDLSGTGLFRWHMLRWGIDRIGKERILFGTDYPINSPLMNVCGVLAEPLTDEERKAVFCDNFLHLTGYDPAAD